MSCLTSQSTSSCSLSDTTLPPLYIWLMPSMEPVVENAQQEPQNA